jgi:hypothetical protein
MSVVTGLFSGLGRFFRSSASSVNGSSVNVRAQVQANTYPVARTQRDLYAVLKAMYLTNGAYDEIRGIRFGISAGASQMKPIRNPVPAIVDFWSAKGFPRPMILTTPATAQMQNVEEQTAEKDPLILAIEQVWTWSNLRRRLPYIGWCAGLFGEVYLKVVASQERGRVWFEVIEPSYVFDYESDERDNLTWIRLDVPKCETNYDTGEVKHYTRTEIWSKDEGRYRIWETEGDAYGKAVRDLGAPVEVGSLMGNPDDGPGLGIDWIPFVRMPFRDVGEKRAIGAVLVTIEAAAEADLMATNLHDVVFNNLEGMTVVTRDGVDANNRPLPPVRVQAATPQTDAFGNTVQTPGQNADGSVTLGHRTLVSLPGGANLAHAVPPIDIPGALALQQDHDQHLERIAPELAYTKISELSGADLSGRAIRYKLTPALDKVDEVRPNLLDGLKAADMMAITLGQVNRIPGFEGLGTFEDGTLEHGFMDQEILPTSDYEQAQTRHEEAAAMQAEQAAGMPFGEILKRTGYSEEQAADVVNTAADEAEASMQRAQDAFGTTSAQQQTQDQQNGAGATNA